MVYPNKYIVCTLKMYSTVPYRFVYISYLNYSYIVNSYIVNTL